MRPRAAAAALAAVLALCGCMQMPMPQGEYEQLYPREPRPQRFRAQAAGHCIAGVRSPGRTAPPILFIHGSPGRWQDWARYADHPRLQGYGPLIVPDRPGFGGSQPGEVVPQLAAQARILAALLEGEEPAIVVGHSLGGPIAGRIAMDYPSRVRGLLLIAPSVAPSLEAPRWYNEVARWSWMRGLIPDVMLWSNDELYGLQAELRLLEPGWARLQLPVYVVQGLDDRLVYPETADYLQARLRHPLSRVERVAGQGHFILWEQPERIVDLLVELIDRSAPAGGANGSRDDTTGHERRPLLEYAGRPGQGRGCGGAGPAGPGHRPPARAAGQPLGRAAGRRALRQLGDGR